MLLCCYVNAHHEREREREREREKKRERERERERESHNFKGNILHLIEDSSDIAARE